MSEPTFAVELRQKEDRQISSVASKWSRKIGQVDRVYLEPDLEAISSYATCFLQNK